MEVSILYRALNRNHMKSKKDITLLFFVGLTYKTWRVFKVTPLYNFGSSPRDLKRYGALLSAHVDAVSIV